MQAIKQAALLRPISRSSSPAPPPSPIRSDSRSRSSSTPITAHAPPPKGPLHMLSFSSVIGRASSVANASAPTIPTPNVTLVQDGSYLEALSLKLSEGVSKALAFPSAPVNGAASSDTFNGKRSLPSGRGKALGDLIAAELSATKDNPQLYRAIVRQLQRPMSVLLTNLSSQLLPILSSPKFLPEPVPNAAPSAAQLHAISIASLAGELLNEFDALSLGISGLPEGRGDGLQTIRDGLEAIIGRVINPLVTAIRQDAMPILAELELQPTDHWVPALKSTAAAAFHPVNPHQTYHPAIAKLQLHFTAHSKCLQKYASISGKTVHSTLAGLKISLIWRALVSLAHRKPRDPATKGKRSASTSPANGGLKKRLTPPSTPRIGITFKGSRPSSPTVVEPTRAGDTRAICDLLETLPHPPETQQLAREAVEEAVADIRALAVLFDTLETFSGPLEENDLEVLTDELPTLIALPVLLNSPNIDKGDISGDVPTLLRLEEKDYRQTCLASFGREEECAETVVKKLLEIFSAAGVEQLALYRWLDDQLEE